MFVGRTFDDGNVPESEQRAIVEDALIPPVYGDAFKKAISKSKLVRVAQAGHAVGQEKPAAVLKAINDFF